MGTAYIDSNGNLVTSKDKKKKNTYTYIDENGNLASAEVPNIPVANKKKKNDWINLGAFDDGYDFGDVTKSILGTTGDVGTSLLKGVSDVGAGAGKLAVGGIAQVADWFGKDEYANKLRKSLAGENKKTNEWLENYTPSGLFEKANKKLDKYSVSGEKLDKINESIGQIAGYGAASSIAPILGTSAMFGSAAGENLSEAYSKEGVTDKQAWAKAIGSGAIEVATERLFGLFGKKGGLDTAIANKISGRLSNGISKILARQGIQATAEGTEEAISYAANQLLDMGIDKLSGKDAAKFYEKWNWEQVGEEFASAALASGIVGIGQTSLGVKDVKNNNNLSTKDAVNEYAKQVDVSEGVLTDNEQKVLNKELQNRIEEQSKDGKTLSKKEISKLEEQIKNDMSKGRISVETIEEALGGNITDNDRLLQTSYNEKANRGVAFNADLSKYNDKQKAVVQKAIDSGVLNNTNRSHELVDLVAKLSEDKGMDFDFVNNEKLKDTGFALEGKQVNGYNTGTSIGINIDSNKALNSVIGHEITHVLEGTDLYNELQNSIMEYAKTKGEYDTRLKELQELYKDVKDANVENELTSDLVGDYLFTDEDFVNRLYNNNRNVFQKIYDEIKYFIKQISPGSKESKQLEQVKRAFEKAYNQKSQQTTGTKYSLNTDEDTSYQSSQYTKAYGRNITADQFIDKNIKIYDNLKDSTEAIEQLNKVKGNPDAEITIYRATPSDSINTGDWVFLDRNYAERLTKSMFSDKPKPGYKVVEEKVKAKDVDWTGKNLEFVYSPNGERSVKYSLATDSNGRELSKQQQEYFKDSKVRDSEGRLLEVYHGTNANFNTYDTIKTEPGYWFTENKEYASEHGKNIKSQYLNLTNPITDIDSMWSLAEEKFGKNVTEKQILSNDFKQFLIEKGYDGMVWDHSGSNTYIAFYPNQIKNIDNTNPTSNEDIRYSLSEQNKQIAPVGNYQIKGKDVKLQAPVKETKTEVKSKAEKKTAPIPIMKKEVKNKLTKAEIEELNNLNIAEEVFDLSKEEQKRKDYLEKKQQGYIERYPGLKKISDFKDIAKEYREYKESTDFDNKLLKEAESLVPGYRDTGRRTKLEWLDIAEYIGNNFKDSSSKNLTKYAIQSWFEAQPNRKDTLNRQGNKFVDFKIQDWINAVYDGAKIGKLEKPNIPINENIKPNKNVLLAENKSDNVLKVTAKGIAKQINETGDFNLKQRKWTETSTESEPLKGKVFIEDLDPSKITYEVQSNKKSLDTANKHLDTYGYDKSLEYVKNLIQGEGLPKASDVALMQRMIQEASKRGDAETVQNLIMDTAILGTDLGQATQALSIIQKLTPEGQLKMYTKLVNRAKARGEKSFQNVEITPEMVEKILNAYNEDGTYDQNDLNARVEDFKQDLANQMKSTVGEKVDAWRYLSMLGNPKTHIRNMVSNIAMTGTVKVKNAMARTLETILPVKDRTKTWKKASQEIKDYAAKTTQEMKGIITGESKYNEKSAIESKKEIFKNKTLEKISNFNSAALEGEDWFFSSRAFKSTFQEYLTANGINTMEDIKNNPELVEKAKNYAVEQAEIATFRQYSKLASMINQFERKGKVGKIAVEALMPFKKTPINVAKAGVSYSPLGLIKNITYDAYQLKQGNINASQFIDNISQGMTGTSLTLLGYALAKAGILTGSGDDDKEGKYDSQLGNKGYSVNIGNKSYSISWLSPVAMPLLVGSNAYEQLEEKKDWDANVVSDSLAKTLDPLNEMSFMQGVTKALSSYDKGTQKLAGIGESFVSNYASQLFPTLFSQIASVTDDKKRSTTPSSNSKYRFGEQIARSLMYKVPGLRQQLEPVTDIWGNEKMQSENILERAFETFIAPYTKTDKIATELDDEIKRVYNEVGDVKVIPGVPNAYIVSGDETYRMSAKEYTEFKKTYGQTANETLNELINSSKYQEADDEDKAKMIEKSYEYARSKAKEEYFDTTDVDYEDKLLNKLETLNKEFGVDASEYITNQQAYDYAYRYPEKYRTITQIADYDDYISYKDEIKDIRNNTSNDKEETIKYINSLKMSIPKKAMFIKQYYKSFNQYDNEIINYVNSQKMSSNKKQQILNELGFTVRDGRVYAK